MVRTQMVQPSSSTPNHKSRVFNQLGHPSTAGAYTKVSSKPSNHSKLTGKCCKSTWAECHKQPACKARDKAKGASKLRLSCEMDFDDGRSFSGASVSDALDRLSYDDSWVDVGVV